MALTTAQIASLTTMQVNQGLTTSQVVALTTQQVQQGLTTTQINQGFTTSQIAAVETRDIVALRTNQVIALNTTQIQSLTTDQVTALTTTQVEAITNAGLQSAFTTDQISHLSLGTPLVLDLNGDGITTQSISNGVKFDLFATGQSIQTGWVAGGDGLLVLDRNNDGLINDGSELFGEATTLANGEKAANGYIALSEMDSNGDGFITSTDSGFAELKVWADQNSDGVSQSNELRTLESLGITKLELSATSSTETDNGNLVGLVSSYETADGTKHAMADVWFVADKNCALDSAATTTSNPTENGLHEKVGGMVQAISSFKASQSTTTSQSALADVNQQPGGANAGALAVAVNVGGMVGALKQFDTNGNALAAIGAVPGASSVPTLIPAGTQNLTNTEILTTGK